jgi:hypothetical protein
MEKYNENAQTARRNALRLRNFTEVAISSKWLDQLMMGRFIQLFGVFGMVQLVT